MQQADSLRETAHKQDDAAIAVAMMNSTIGSTAPRSTSGPIPGPTSRPTHEPKAGTASPASDDVRTHEPRSYENDWIDPERIRTMSNLAGSNLLSPNLVSPDRTHTNLMGPNLMSPNLTSPDLMRAATLTATLATLRGESETLTEVAHDARNMVTALGLYCEFLEEPGVLATPFRHYGQELRLVAAASRRLVEKIVALNYQTTAQDSAQTNAKISAEAAAKLAVLTSDLFPSFVSSPTPSGRTATELSTVAEDGESGAAQQAQTATAPATAVGGAPRESEIFQNPNRRWDLLPTVPVANLAAELAINHNLLAALAGPSIALTVHAEGCARPVWLTGEDLTRVLVNLVKNSAEAMLSGGQIHIALREQPAEHAPESAPKSRDDQGAAYLLLTVEDNGPGIPAEAEETIFASGFTSHGASVGLAHGSPATWSPNHDGPNFRDHGHRGLGLAISRSIIEGAGGRITAANREQGGARFALELPLREAHSCAARSESFPAGSSEINDAN